MSASPADALPRQLGLWSATAVVVGLTIGSGIFRTPATIATRLPGPLPLVATWILGGLVALCGALTLAELSAAHPRTGGLYVYIKHAFGRLPAFLTAALGVGFVLLRTFEQLADTFITAILPFYALGVGSIFVFRRRGAVYYLTVAELQLETE